MSRYGLIGKNISYSLSKNIHKQIAKINNIKLTYELIDINENELKNYLKLLKEGIYQGYNITTPYKEIIIPLLDDITEASKAIGAVNTIYLKEGKVIGDNTDYLGFDYTLLKSGALLRSLENVYILGSGGAAKACYYVFNKRGVKSKIISRTGSKKPFEKVISYDDFKKENKIDLLVNATPLGNINNPQSPISNNKNITTIIDLTYNPKKTILMSYGKHSYNGIKMLIYQAIASQKKWHKLKLSDDEIIKKVKGNL